MPLTIAGPLHLSLLLAVLTSARKGTSLPSILAGGREHKILNGFKEELGLSYSECVRHGLAWLASSSTSLRDSLTSDCARYGAQEMKALDFGPILDSLREKKKEAIPLPAQYALSLDSDITLEGVEQVAITQWILSVSLDESPARDLLNKLWETLVAVCSTEYKPYEREELVIISNYLQLVWRLTGSG